MSDFLPFAWRPSGARTLRLFDYAGASPRALLPAALPLRWPDKPVAAQLDYTLDATALLAGPSDAVSGVVTSAPGVALLAAIAAGGLFTLWLAGGVAGTDNPITLTLTTLSTRRVNRIVRLLTV